MSVSTSIYTQDNNVGVSVFAAVRGEIVFDIAKAADHQNAAFSSDKVYQNLTIRDATRLRKALKRAIKEATK